MLFHRPGRTPRGPFLQKAPCRNSEKPQPGRKTPRSSLCDSDPACLGEAGASDTSKPALLFEADSMSMHLRESKNDQFQRGQVHSHHSTNESICPVRALQAHGRENPQWITDPSSVVFQLHGVGITREAICELLRLAAAAEGYPAQLVGSHSRRKGGATAMLACTDDIEQVKRFGEWKSDAAHAYLYSDHASCPSRASAMLRSAPILPSTQRPGSISQAAEHSLGEKPPSRASTSVPQKIVERGILGSGGLGVAVSASFFVFHHCILSFRFLRVCFVFHSCSLGSCFLLWSSYSFFLRGVLFVLFGLGSLFVLVLSPRGVNLI